MLVCYVAGFADPNEAVEAVKAFIGDFQGDTFKEPAQLSDATVEALRIKPGNVWMA
jgi:hypothetical protein